jgi:molecular chaperone DnaK (HSP70)
MLNKAIGIDLGTSTTEISIFDPEKKIFKQFKSNNDNPYFDSIISYRKSTLTPMLENPTPNSYSEYYIASESKRLIGKK